MQGSNGDADIKTCGYSGGRRGWSDERVTETHTSRYVKQRASGNLLYEAGSSNSVLCDNLEKWDGVGGGREGVYV